MHRQQIPRTPAGPAESKMRHFPVKILSGSTVTDTAQPFTPSFIHAGVRLCREATVLLASLTASFNPSDTMSISPVCLPGTRVSIGAPPTATR